MTDEPASPARRARNPLHHVELWTRDLVTSRRSFGWLMTELGWPERRDPDWPAGTTYHHRSGVYLVLEQSPAIDGDHVRTHAGLNHLAFRVDGRAQLDALRDECGAHGWTELFAENYPHAGGEDHTALFLANDEGFEVELVVD